MTDVIARLIDIGALPKDSILTARKGTLNRFGIMTYISADYVLKGICNQDQEWSLTLRQSDGREEIVVPMSDITAIDGMSIDRYAEIYNINPDGSMKSMGRKRGRKPKMKISVI
jgi:hypothetical protein